MQEQPVQEQQEQQEEQQEAQVPQADKIAEQVIQQLQKQSEKVKEEEEVRKLLESILPPQMPTQPTEEELEELAQDPKKLVSHVLSLVESLYIQPILVKMEQARVQEEIKMCREKYENFDELKDEVLKYAIQHPTLSLDEAYRVVAGEKIAPRKKEEKKEGKVVSIEEFKRTHGEKRTVSRQTMKEAPTDIRSAAAKAIAEILGEAVPED